MDIEHHTYSSGNTPTLKFLKKLPFDHKRQVLEDINLLIQFDLPSLLKSGVVEKVKGIQKTIWELRSSCKINIIYRTLFEIDSGIFHILHIFNKKTKKIDQKEIKIAVSRSNQ